MKANINIDKSKVKQNKIDQGIIYLFISVVVLGCFGNFLFVFDFIKNFSL